MERLMERWREGREVSEGKEGNYEGRHKYRVEYEGRETEEGGFGGGREGELPRGR